MGHHQSLSAMGWPLEELVDGQDVKMHCLLHECCSSTRFPPLLSALLAPLLPVVSWICFSPLLPLLWRVAASSHGDIASLCYEGRNHGNSALAAYSRAVTVYSSKLGGPGVGGGRTLHRPVSASHSKAKGTLCMLCRLWPQPFYLPSFII